MDFSSARSSRSKLQAFVLFCILAICGLLADRHTLLNSSESSLFDHAEPTSVTSLFSGKNASQRIEECDVKPLRNISYFFGYFQQDLYPCENKENVGGADVKLLLGLIKFRDGDKWVCTDEGVGPPSRGCLVYSFGINYEWSFDDAMAERGCKVYTLDPTEDSRSSGSEKDVRGGHQALHRGTGHRED
ncbi:uncharacterized protein LOC119594898 [Penaeus monodon]|uniref:uncharacterized protein LOC119594898 n=1 Tax=Penaeus monodon TaxID=6687 RepID=UPI0018A70CAC|nr:uncharacterized protein LOC119594898 [Penaeus monodon]